MKYVLKSLFLMVSVLFLLVGLCSCNYASKKAVDETKQTYFIQLQWDCPGITQLRQAIKPVINKILQEELGQEKSAGLFLEKKQQALTIYYVNDMREQDEQLLLSSLDGMQHNKKFFAPQNITTTATIDFFGEWHDELVILVNDSEGELASLNKEMKEMLHALDAEYKTKNGYDLFDISKSEQFPFVPHIGLGRIRSNSIKAAVQESGQNEEKLERIKKRVKEEVLGVIQKTLTPANSKIFFEKIFIFSVQKRVSIKDYLLK